MCARVSRPTFADADTASDPFWETLEIASYTNVVNGTVIPEISSNCFV